jgi:hypothetical protein
MKESAIQNPCQTTMADFSDRTNSTMCLTIAGSAGGMQCVSRWRCRRSRRRPSSIPAPHPRESPCRTRPRRERVKLFQFFDVILDVPNIAEIRSCSPPRRKLRIGSCLVRNCPCLFQPPSLAIADTSVGTHSTAFTVDAPLAVTHAPLRCDSFLPLPH